MALVALILAVPAMHCLLVGVAGVKRPRSARIFVATPSIYSVRTRLDAENPVAVRVSESSGLGARAHP